MAKVFLICGKICSGKTYYAKELKEKHFDEIIAIMNSGLKKQAEKSPELLEINDDCKLRNLLNFISTQNYSKVALIQYKVAGFISISSEGETYFDPSLRGTGIPQLLLNHVCKTVQDEGKKIIGVDYETLNPTALNFWTKYFKPYTYSFARRIDERIL